MEFGKLFSVVKGLLKELFLYNPTFIYLCIKVTILSVSDNKIRITVDDKRTPTYNQEGNLLQEPITQKPGG